MVKCYCNFFNSFILLLFLTRSGFKIDGRDTLRVRNQPEVLRPCPPRTTTLVQASLLHPVQRCRLHLDTLLHVCPSPPDSPPSWTVTEESNPQPRLHRPLHPTLTDYIYRTCMNTKPRTSLICAGMISRTRTLATCTSLRSLRTS